MLALLSVLFNSFHKLIKQYSTVLNVHNSVNIEMFMQQIDSYVALNAYDYVLSKLMLFIQIYQCHSQIVICYFL